MEYLSLQLSHFKRINSSSWNWSTNNQNWVFVQKHICSCSRKWVWKQRAKSYVTAKSCKKLIRTHNIFSRARVLKLSIIIAHAREDWPTKKHALDLLAYENYSWNNTHLLKEENRHTNIVDLPLTSWKKAFSYLIGAHFVFSNLEVYLITPIR